MNQKALTLEPTSLDAKFGIAMVYFNQRRLAEAKRALEEILKENDEFYPGYMRLDCRTRIRPRQRTHLLPARR
jgi:cytochrome c-type biogenesis protein CcmH/NrfG